MEVKEKHDLNISKVRAEKKRRIYALAKVDGLFIAADTALEFLRLTVNRRVSALQLWLFLQNQRMHGVDISRFCNNAGGAAA